MLRSDERAAAARSTLADAARIRARVDAFPAHDCADDLYRIACPTRVMAAADCAVTLVYRSRIIAEAVLGAELRTFA